MTFKSVYFFLILTHFINVRYTEGANKNGQSRGPGNIGYKRRRKTKQKHNTIFFGYHYAQANPNNVSKTCALPLATRGKDEPNIVFM
jgi:hypothetical protein